MYKTNFETGIINKELQGLRFPLARGESNPTRAS